MKPSVIPLRAFADNYVWTLRDATSAVVVDPGEARPVLDYLKRENLKLVAILNTHHHNDHVGGNAELLAHYPVPVFGPSDDRIATVSQRLKEGDRIRLPHFGTEFAILDIPAHTRTHIAFYGEGMLYCGDTLFAMGCGRLFEGTPADMHAALSKLARLPDDTLVYCGHEYTESNIRFAKVLDPENQTLLELEDRARKLRAQDLPTVPTRMAEEKAANPFMRCDQPEIRAAASRHAGKDLAQPVSVLEAIRDWKNGFK
jgi:hydroxyacylglutathione hydrolase